MRLDVLGAGDGPRLRALRRRALATDPDAFYRTASEEDSEPDDAVEARAADPDARWLVAVDDDGDGADVALACLRPSHDGDPAHEVVSVWVAPEARGAGVARALVMDLVEHARTTGLPGITLWLATANRSAAALYASLGFTATGRTGAFPPPRQIAEHELRLDLRFGAGTDGPPARRP